MAKRNDPYKNYKFRVEIDGIDEGGFREVTIPDSTQDAIEYRVGTDTTTVRKLPGLTKYGNVSLKWGITDSTALYDWRKEVVDGKDARKNMSIILLNDVDEAVARWNFIEAWPTKYDAPDLNATGNEIAIETMEIVCEGMTREKP